VIPLTTFKEPEITLLPFKIKLPVFFTLAESSGLTTSTPLPDCLINTKLSGTLMAICPTSNDAVVGEVPGVKLLMCSTFGDIVFYIVKVIYL
jgi:hypothetical protein